MPNINLREPWYAIDGLAERRSLQDELRREISDDHVLAGVSVILLARRGDTDAVLYGLPDGRVAEVHLTWSTDREIDRRWPATAMYVSIDEWASQSMVPTHKELAGCGED